MGCILLKLCRPFFLSFLIFEVIGTIVLSWAVPSQAETPDLEQQVLQIIRKNPEAVIESIQTYQRQKSEQQQKARQEFLQKMRANAQAVIGHSPVRGSVRSKIVLVEFSDFQCPYCATALEPIKKFMENHQKDVALVYKHLPLTAVHSEAMPAAKAAWAAGQQGKFWEYHDALFAKQEQLGEKLYVAIAQELSLSLDQFNQDRQGTSAEAAIRKDIALAEEIGVSGTPFLIMNGEMLMGKVQIESLENLLGVVVNRNNTSLK